MPLNFPSKTIGSTTLRPLAESDAEALIAAAKSPETFRYFSNLPAPFNEQGMLAFIQDLHHTHNTIPYTVLHNDTPVGITTYLNTSEKHRHTEIGWTWYAPTARGTHVNPAAKRIMLETAFAKAEQTGFDAIRVAFRTDLRNTQSQRAIEKLGATKEGILRHNVIMPDGHRRSSVLYAILAEEWPAIRTKLDTRLATHSSA